MVRGVKTIGIVGGGQLGRMLTLAAKPLGFKVVVVEPTINSPASQVGAKQITASLYDQTALKKLASLVDVITIETEHLDSQTLATIAKLGKPVHPSPTSLRLIQDKFGQKVFFSERKIPVAPFQEISDETSTQSALRRFKSMLIKTRYGGFDGRGNAVVKNKQELKNALSKFKDQPIYAEKYVPFFKELAVMVARSTDGKLVIYPVVETKQIRNICVEVRAPAEISDTIRRRAVTLAKKVAGQMEGAGVYGIEMFLTKDGKVLLNEVAPRVHNSGHYTIDGNETSQFEQHIRGVTGLPLGRANLLHPAVVMVNILGERNAPTKIAGVDEALRVPGVRVYLYGKSPTMVDRKMGHITAVGDTIKSARSKAYKARRRVQI